MDTIPDPEVPERPTRRRFSAAYKVAILDELDHASVPRAKVKRKQDHRDRVMQDHLPMEWTSDS